MTDNTTIRDLCGTCTKLLAENNYLLRRVEFSGDRWAKCEGCHKERFCGTFEVRRKKEGG